METFVKYVSTYQNQLEKGDIQKAYVGLIQYMMRLKATFSKNQSKRFSFGNISPGYLDFTYFPFFNDFLRARKLRFGIILNHENMQFEIWLMGQNKNVQERYWAHLKETKWNNGRTDMPQYAILEAIILKDPDFNDLDDLTYQIEMSFVRLANDILYYLDAHDIS